MTKTTTETIEETDLVISLEGKILDSNFDEFRSRLKERIRSLNYELKTDADFDSAEQNAKALKGAEKSLAATKEHALEQAEDIQKLFAAIDDVSDEAKEARLNLEKQIKARKDQRKREILDAALDSLDATLKRNYRQRIEQAMKGKRTIDTLERAAQAEAKTIQSEVDAARKIIERHRVEHGATLLHDVEALEQRPAEDVAVELSRRLERQRDEEEKKRLREEAEKRQREQRESEAKAKAEAEARAKQDLPSNLNTGPAEATGERNTGPTVGARTVESSGVAARANATVFSGHRTAASEPKAETPSEEMQRFRNTVVQAFGPVKEARAQLIHPQNIERAERFAKVLTEGWKQLAEGGAE